ncbi:hypothetical protein [Taklimakanibacter albus]|uniref:Uncharacterized protein n=1 Tax=Taklimakanibacter albus TaxID=2800327 RepID=A0ACC5RBH4_9HYPH|nr:hypothetical protein [Aestuariivirga sp. YIM B02566]MBK1869957.1 hypothetical protein [Aestuariivirga sp. YIM B02566]
MRDESATVIAFLIAPVFPALLLGIGTPLSRDGPKIITILGLFPIGYVYSAAVTGLFAFPLFLLGTRMGLVRRWSATICGYLIGTFVSAGLQWPYWGGIFDPATLHYGATGVVSGFVFWLIWRQGQART